MTEGPVEALSGGVIASGATAATAAGSTGLAASTGSAGSTGSAASTGKPPKEKRPLYPRLLRLKNVHPNAWQRAALGEGAIGVAGLLCLADVASLWTLVVLPVGVAAVVKAHDLLAGLLQGTPAR